MTLSSLSHNESVARSPESASAVRSPSITPTEVMLDYELVRGMEARAMAELLPRVQRESLAMNLSTVPRIDAAGIATLIRLYCSSVEAGTEFSVIAPSPRVLGLLRLVGLEALLVAETDKIAEA